MTAPPEPQAPPDEWILACWSISDVVYLLGYTDPADRWAKDSPFSTRRGLWKRWNSYHAARAFQRRHPALASYIVRNLSEIERQAAAQSESFHDGTQAPETEPRSEG